MIKIEACTVGQQWDNEILEREGHPLQLWGWGKVKSRGSWRAERVLAYDDDQCVGMCQILLRPLPWPLKGLAYVPRGPVTDPIKREAILEALAVYVKNKYGVVSIVIEPDWETMPEVAGWKRSPNPILMARTVILDLSQTEEELLSPMTKKTRQYIRKSENSGVVVKLAKDLDDVAACLAIYKETSQRAGFDLHKDSYYEDIFEILGSHSQLFIASYDGRLVAFLWLAVSGDTAFELYGGMNDEGQQLRANYILKWTAILRTKEWGITRYDMNGLLNDGVSQFKQGFADHETQLAGSFEKPLSVWYPFWTKGLPAAKKLIRLVKK